GGVCPRAPRAAGWGGGRAALPTHRRGWWGGGGYPLPPSPPQVLWLERNLPFYTNFSRLKTTSFIRVFMALSDLDPEFDGDPNACNPMNRAAREVCMEFLRNKLGDDELVAKMTPPHPAASARPVNCDPEYNVLDAIQRDDVELVTDGIRCINAWGIETSDGTQHDVDVIVYATGFRANDYLFPMTITGRDGRTIEEVWADDGPRAYVGCMVPGFPNLWTVYGPNTNGALFPSSLFELVTRYALECMEHLVLHDAREVEVVDDAYRTYNELIDERNRRKAWSGAKNYYWSDQGRSATMNPLSSE